MNTKGRQDMQYRVTDPDGVEHVKNSKTKVFTHATVRRNRGSDHYFVNFASSADAANREARVQRATRDYVAVVPVEEVGP